VMDVIQFNQGREVVNWDRLFGRSHG
jgi:hypothetical protein